MLFSKITQMSNSTTIFRKENDSFLDLNTSDKSIITSPTIHRVSPRFYGRRASLYTSENPKGSITIEAALAVPIFFFALLCVLYLLEIISVQMTIRTGMYQAMQELAVDSATETYISTAEIEQRIIEWIGKDTLDNSIVVDGSMGIDSQESSISMVTGMIDLEVSYDVQLPIPQFGLSSIHFVENVQGKAWTGYVSGINEGDEDTVYITDNQAVYHLDKDCTYLVLAIDSASYGQVESLSNAEGESYYACSFCVTETQESNWSENQTIYITESGNHYHSSLQCSGLTRTIYGVPLSDVIGKGVCSRCGE